MNPKLLLCSLGFLSLILTTFRSPAATVVWTNTAGGNWNVAANWSPNQLPTVADDVFITNNGTYAVTLNVASTNGTLTVGGASGTQSLTNTAQTLTVPGAVLFNPNGRLVVSGGTITTSNTFTMNGTFLWNGGTFSGTNALVFNTSVPLAGAGTKTLSGKTLVNNSSITYSAGIFSTTGGATISNTPAGIFDVASDVGVTAAAGVRFFNAGLIRKSSGVGTSVLAPIMNNTGTVEVQTGTLQLDGSTVTNAGSCTVAAGATLVVSPTTGAFLAGSTVGGAGNFTVSGGGTIEILGSLSISGTNTFNGGGTTVNFSGNSYSLSGGTLNSLGSVNFNGAGTVTLSILNLGGGNLGGSNNATISGLFTWTGGNLIGSGSVIANGGIYYPAGSARALNGRTLINNATMTWEGGSFGLNGGAIFSNAPAATVNLTTGVGLTSANPADLFLNAGTFRKTSDDPVTKSIAGKFINTGTVEIQGGGLLFTGSATNTGTYLVSAGATLELSGNPIAMAAGSSISGVGNFSVTGGTSDLAGSLGVGGTNTVIGGTANFSGGSYTISGGTLNILSGNANFNGSGTVTPAILNLSGGNLGGSNSVIVSGLFTWSGGNIVGTNSVTANGGLIFTGGTTRGLTSRTLINTATATWDSQNISLASGAVISNAPGADFNLTTGLNILAPFGGGVFANAGTFRRTSANSNLTTVACIFNNSGLVEIQAGGIQFNNSGTHSGTFEVFAGATLDLSASTGTNNLTAGSSVNNAGNFTVSGGTANLSGALAVSGTNTFSAGTANFSGTYSLVNGTMNITGGTANFNGDGTINPVALNFSSGTLGGSNNVTVNGPIVWTGGTITGTNSVIANGGLTVSGAGAKTLTSRSLINSANAVMTNSGSITLASGAVVSNAPAGTWNIAADVNITGSGSVANAGLFRKSVGSLSTINVPFANSGTLESLAGLISFNGASIYTQTEGLTLLNGGNLTNSSPLRIQGGTLAGTGTIFGSVTNSGTVSPGTSPGQLIIVSNYVQTAAGAMNVELAGTPASGNYDRLVVSNSMTLDGALNVTLTNSYYPTPDVVFTNVLRAAARTGTFATFNFPSNSVGLQINYSSTNVDLEIINTLPSLPPISNQTMDELTTLNFNVAASDGDAPAQTLTYTLANSPTNASINASGQLTWQPTEAQGPFTTNITVVVTDNGTPNLTTNVTFQVVVREINVVPVLTLPAPTSINEQTAYSATATATDSDVPTNSLTFALVSGPAGLAVSPTGAINWTPLESQGSNTYTVFISVTDTNPVAFNATFLSVTNSYQITVNEVNLPPVLTPPSNQTITEENPLSGVTASATDPDFPANPLTYSLVTPPAGMSINPGTGAITWTPDESQGSNTFAIKIVVTDTNALAVNAKSISVTNTFNVTVNESNRPPILTVPGNQIITEENTLSVSASATDPDLPTNVLAFTLIAPPAGMTINTNTGAISWLPNESQGSNSYTITVVVADTNSPAINARFFRVTNTFNVTVNESNRPPVLTLPASQAISELVLFTNNATATDLDFPANALTYALVSGPTGMVVTASGGISWTPSEFQGPTNAIVQIKVTDSNALAINSSALSVTNSFTLTVNEVNVAPVVGTLLNQSGNAGQTVSFTATATDADLPTNTLSFSLVSPPSGASIGAGSGLFTWRLPAALANTTNTLRVRVTDNGSPNLSGTNTFTVTVNSILPVVLTPLSYSNGLFRLSITGSLGPDYVLEGGVSLISFTNFATNTPVAMPFTFTNASAFSNGFYRVRLNP